MTRNTTILLTGVNGFLGNYLAPALLEAGYTVYGIGRGVNRLSVIHTDFHYLDIDLTDYNSLHSIFQTIQPNIVIHAAANSKPDECELDQTTAYRVNVVVTKDLLALAITIQSRFIYISTDFVFDGEKGTYKESDLLNPINYYGKTKQLSEALVAQYSFDYAIVRTVLVYGKPLSGRQNILSLVYSKLCNGEPFQLVNDHFRTPTYIEDLVWGITQIILLEKTGTWHLSGDAPLMTPYDMGIQLAEMFQLNTSLLISVSHTVFNEIALRPSITGLNIQKAKTELNYCPTPFIDALRKIFPL